MEHLCRTKNVDDKHPILLDPSGQLFDGAHRVAKAMMAGRTTAKAVKMLEVPPPDEILDGA